MCCSLGVSVSEAGDRACCFGGRTMKTDGVRAGLLFACTSTRSSTRSSKYCLCLTRAFPFGTQRLRYGSRRSLQPWLEPHSRLSAIYYPEILSSNASTTPTMMAKNVRVSLLWARKMNPWLYNSPGCWGIGVPNWKAPHATQKKDDLQWISSSVFWTNGLLFWDISPASVIG
jgi:hypothetical protein